ncbi:methionyl-tRNA formyltransferase [Nitratiruptor tergarcus]|uniref:Methionyl-tRNA formyltransferase n=1 Tax=Nitratiruptor tergarcus DSM 16512 TaxID=1069081 RepID=A0A1W1WUJ1_9BACT|nr:methionyl-tRNA formyltransferase [Nitratiruptor tergarcus]SMC09947.1 methionyl-tRNA formyltransferase [Nitratiruptor tergarcus DSM 16512]
MRIVFMGTPDYATKILEGLLGKFDIVALVTQPDKPVGRKQVLTPPHIKRFVLEQGLDIPILQPPTLKDKKVIEQIASFKPDFIVVAAYGMLLPKEILSIAPSINLHASLLPRYRGASPIQQALLEGDTITGVTAMLMDEGLDTGDILAYDVCEIEENDTAITLFAKLADLAANLTPLVLERFKKIKPLPQLDVDASYCKKIKKSDGEITLDDATTTYNKYRAFIVWPGIFLPNGLKLKKIALFAKEGEHRAGEILAVEKDFIVVGCERGSLKVERVQPPSKKEMDAVAYIRGQRIGIGDTLF